MLHREFTQCFKEVVEKEKGKLRAYALGVLIKDFLMEARDMTQNMEKERWEDKEND